MKARFLALAALVLGLASCQKDFDAANVGAGGEVDFQLSVAAPELATRAGLDGVTPDGQADLNSAYGAIDYFQGGTDGDNLRRDWSDVNLRYTLEVYDVDENGNLVGEAPYAPVKDRQVIIVDEYQPVTFELRLVPKRHYRFVVFADFVPEDVTNSTSTAIAVQQNLGISHKIGNTLADIKVINSGLNDERTDAYFGYENFTITNSASNDIVLKRPYGKLRVIATDLHELNLNVNPKKVKVEYTATHLTNFDAVTGAATLDTEYTKRVFDSEYNEIYKEVDEKNGKFGLQNHFYTTGYDALEGHKYENANGAVRHTHMTLFTDYILADDLDQPQPVHFTMTVYDRENKEIKSTTFNTDIPVQRNYLTTVIGNVLTTATEVEVRIDDNFAGEYEETLWDGKYKEPAYDAATQTYTIYEESELAWLAAAVNGTLTRASEPQTFVGKTFKLAADIDLDLNGDRWTPIGATGKFLGTFDGQGNTIYNLLVSETGKASAGLFANGRVIKNLYVENAEVYGHYKTGVIIGDGLCAQIENCHVKNAKIVVTPINNDDANNVGGIVGYLSAEPTAYVKNCSVENAEITAYRKVAGIVGAANGASVVTGNTVKNVTITADQTAEYKEFKAAEAGEIAGYINANAQVEDNNVGENVKVIIKVDSNEEAVPALTTKCKNLEVVLAANVDVPIGELGQITAGSGEYKLGAENTETITIDLGGKKLNITTTYWSNLGAKNNNALFTIKNGTMTSSQASGTWNSYDLTFSNCDYVFENVAFEKAIAFDNAGKNVTLNDVTIKETHDYYAMWITATGQTVNIDGLTVESDGRGIKIDEQYVGTPAKVTLNVKDAKFTTVNKAAIMVKSAAGADITLENVNIENVAADTVNAVWVDSDAAKYAGKVNVIGGTKIIEGSTVISENIASKADVQNALKDAVAAKQEIVVIDAQGAELNLNYGLSRATVPAGSTVTITNAKVVGSCYGNGADGTVVFENCSFNNPNGAYSIHFDSGSGDVIFRNCQLYGWNSFGSSLNSVTFENCTLEGNGHYALIRSYADLTMSDCTVDTTNANHDDVYDEGVQVIEPATFTQNNVTYIVSNDVDLKNVLEQGGDVVLESDFTIDETESNGYGKTGINMNNGGTLDGNGNELGAPGSTGTWDSAINTSGGTIKNIKVTKGFRGIFIKKDDNHNEKLYLDNVTIDGTTYTISCDSGNGLGLEATNSTFKGWTSYAATLGNAKFVDCYFGYGNGYSFCRPYAPTEFVGCEFEAGLRIDNRANVTFENCTLDGVALTQENIEELVYNSAKATVK